MAVLLALTGAGHCAKHLNPAQFTRAVNVAYAGTRTPTRQDQASLRRYVRCAPAWSRPYDRNVWTLQKRANAQRRWVAAHPPFHPIVASYFDAAGGPIACGGDSYAPGVASRTLPCGTRLEVCAQSCTEAVVFDRGPAAWTGRDLDLSRRVADAIGFPLSAGVVTVRYRLLH